jgi:hypothetical protein
MKSTMSMDMDTLIEELNRSAKEAYKGRMLPSGYSVNTNGRKYFKIIQDGGGVVCFVEKETGNIYKPAGWKAPYTKGVNAVRANIHEYSTFMNRTDPYGSWLYI